MKRAGIAAVAWAAVLSTLALVSACQAGPSRQEKSYQNFLTAATTVSRDDYRVYWLGREFSAGELTFKGPYVGDLADEAAGSVGIAYDAPAGSGVVVPLWLRVYSRRAWEPVSQRFEGTSGGRTIRTVKVAGRTARIILTPVETRRVNDLALVVDFGDAVVVADTHSLGGADPGGPELNPLVEEQTFLSVMDNLRPYPE